MSFYISCLDINSWRLNVSYVKRWFLYGTKLHTARACFGKLREVGAFSGNAGKLRRGLFVLYIKRSCALLYRCEWERANSLRGQALKKQKKGPEDRNLQALKRVRGV